MLNLSIEEKVALVKTRLNTLDRNLSEEQLDFILHPIDKACFLKACPGSGKTEVVGIKAAYEISDWKDQFTGLAVLSFTKNAAKEIGERIKKFGGTNATQHPHFIGTIDSWLHGYILHPFAQKITGFIGKNGNRSYSLLENSTDMGFLENTNYHIKYEHEIKDKKGKVIFDKYGNPKIKLVPFYATEFHLTHNGNPIPNTENKSFHKNINLKDLIRIKTNLNKDGFCTYQDAEHLCYLTLKNNQNILESLAKRFPYIIIDECQDLSQNQLRTFHLLIEKGVSIFLIGDINQSIYEFRRVDIEKINGFIKHHKFEQKSLSKNFRSNQKIVNVSLGLEKYNTGISPNQIIGNEVERVSKSCIVWEYTDEDLCELPQKFIDYVNLINSTSQHPDLHILINRSGILARGHNTLSNFRSHPSSNLNKIELIANALNCWSNNPRTGKDIQNALQQIGKAISILAYNGKGNHQHQYCPDVYNQIEWRNQLSDLINQMTNNSTGIYPFTNLTWKQWIKKLKHFLENYWGQLRFPINDWDSVKGKIKSASGMTDKLVSETLKALENTYSEKIRMTTFHDVKGETLDAVLVISSKDKKSKGGHYEHWLSEDVSEKEFVRFAYVASSRPKHLLIWAIPNKTNNKYLEKIINLGFETE